MSVLDMNPHLDAAALEAFKSLPEYAAFTEHEKAAFDVLASMVFLREAMSNNAKREKPMDCSKIDDLFGKSRFAPIWDATAPREKS